MPASFLRADAPGGIVPVVDLPLRLGADLECPLHDPSAGVAAVHATLRRDGGAYALAAEGALRFAVGDRETNAAVLRDGDSVRLAPGAAAWRFRHGPQEAPAVPESRRQHVHVAVLDGVRCVVKRLPPVRAADADERHRRLLGAIGGSPHRALAPLVDGGVATFDGRPGRWLATRWVEGTSARDLVEEGGLPAGRVLPILHALAAGLVHLHARGVVHRDLAPGNVIVSPEGSAVLIDYGHAVCVRDELPESAGIVGTPGFVAPEEIVEGPAAVSPSVDVYGLAAVGYTLITGAAPSCGDDVLDALASATIAPAHPSAYGIELPAALETALLDALGPDPARRPDAAAFAAAIGTAESELGLGEPA